MSGHTSWFYEADTSSNPNNHPKGDFMVGDCPERPDNIAVCTGLDRARLIAAAPTQHEEMLRFLPIIERAEADPELWARLTQGTGIATANGYRAAITKATQP